MERLEADLRVAFPHTGGHFSCLVALIMHNALKFPAFQRPVRVHAMRELGLTELKETKKDTRHQKGPSQDSSTCSWTLLAWLTPRTGENSDRYLLPLPMHPELHHLTCPKCLSPLGREELSIRLCFGLVHTQQQSLSSSQWQEPLSHGALGLKVAVVQTKTLVAVWGRTESSLKAFTMLRALQSRQGALAVLSAARDACMYY